MPCAERRVFHLVHDDRRRRSYSNILHANLGRAKRQWCNVRMNSRISVVRIGFQACADGAGVIGELTR